QLVPLEIEEGLGRGRFRHGGANSTGRRPPETRAASLSSRERTRASARSADLLLLPLRAFALRGLGLLRGFCGGGFLVPLGPRASTLPCPRASSPRRCSSSGPRRDR